MSADWAVCPISVVVTGEVCHVPRDLEMDDFFQELVDEFYEDAYRFALSLARNPDDACDLTQQVYANAASHLHQLRDRTKAKSWLFTALYRGFLKSKAREKRQPLAEEEDIAKLAAPVAGGEQEVSHGELRDALLRLEESHRVILGLFYMDQISYKEIAVILDIPIGTVMSRLARAKGALREMMNSGNRNPSRRSNTKNPT